ncbi:MAG: DUF167 domain-containing protein [Dehalococcoidales bacterium]|nr:DUF167 domain-containing protein [Dehalococcoidales bacterium]
MDAVFISIKVLPGSQRNEVAGKINNIWRIKIAAPPEKGKANKELIEFLSQRLNLRKDCIQIVKGETSHNKLVSIQGLSLELIEKKLAPD